MKTLFFLKMKCANNGQNFYARHDFAADDRWVLTYGVKELPIGENVGGAGMEVDYTAVRTGPQYKCPHCGNIQFVRCGACGEYTCHPIGREHKNFKCAHCGNEGEICFDRFIESVKTKSTGSGQ